MITMKQISCLFFLFLVGSRTVEARCILKSDGSYGHSSGASVRVNFEYELEYDPNQLLDVSSSVIPALEKSFNKAVLLSLFPSDCREDFVDDSSAIGISTLPEDSLLFNALCTPMLSVNNACKVVGAALTVYFEAGENNSKTDVQNKAKTITQKVLESLRSGMEERKFILSISMKRISFHDRTSYSQDIRDGQDFMDEIENQDNTDAIDLSQGESDSHELSQEISNLKSQPAKQESQRNKALIEFLIVLPSLIILCIVIYCFFRKKKQSKKVGVEKELKKDEKDYCLPHCLNMEDEASSVTSGGFVSSHASGDYTSDYTSENEDISVHSFESANVSTTSSDGLFSYYSTSRPVRQTSSSTNGDESISSRARFREIIGVSP